MGIREIIEIAILCAVIVGGIIAFFIALFRGDMKKFIELKMIEVEQLGLKGDKKLAYVIEAFKEEYKISWWLVNCKKFIEHIIDLSKKINAKK